MKAIFMRYPGGKAKAVTFSYDDGVIQDVRLAELFDRYGMKCTFNFTGERPGRFTFTSEEIREHFLSKGHEIAVHGAYHRASGNIRPIEGIREVLDCRLVLEEKCGRIIRGMAYPDTGITQMGGATSYERIRSYLIDLDIAYARTLSGDNDRFQLPEDFYAWMPNAHHNNPQIMEYVDRFLNLDLSTKAYHAKRNARLLYIWGHSYEFDRHDNWDRMEAICQALANREDIWYATNMEICEYVQAYRRLIYSANGGKVYNPTVKTIWLDDGGEIYCVKPDETIEIPNRV